MGNVTYHIIINTDRLKGKYIKALETVEDVFRRAGRDYVVHTTNYNGHAKDITAELTKSGEMCHIVVMGGDGTLHQVINGVTDPEKCCIGLIPIGTGNDFAASIGLDSDVKNAAHIIAFMAPTKIDYIQLSNGLRSINAVGMGLDCDVLKRAYKGKFKGKLKYLFACIISLLCFKSYSFTAEIDGVVSEHYGVLTCLGNGTQIGGGIKVFPDASLNDGEMDLIMVDFISKRKAMMAFLALMRGKLKPSDKITITRAKKVKITCHEENYTIQAEGELYDNVPLDCEIVHDKLNFYMPNKYN